MGDLPTHTTRTVIQDSNGHGGSSCQGLGQAGRAGREIRGLGGNSREERVMQKSVAIILESSTGLEIC